MGARGLDWGFYMPGVAAECKHNWGVQGNRRGNCFCTELFPQTIHVWEIVGGSQQTQRVAEKNNGKEPSQST